MGILSRLIASFVVIIAMMVVGYSIFDLYVEFRNTRLEANERVKNARSKIHRDLGAAVAACSNIRDQVISNGPIMQALVSRNRASEDKLVRNFVDSSRFSGDITLIDLKGNVFYSTESPKEHGYSAINSSEIIKLVFNNPSNQVYYGVSDFSKNNEITVSSVSKIMDKDKKLVGIIAISQPLNIAYLTGEKTKISLEEINPVDDIDFALYSKKTKKVVAATKGLVGNNKNPFLNDLTTNGESAFPSSMIGLGIAPLENLLIPVDSQIAKNSFEKNGRWWYRYSLSTKGELNPNGQEIGILLITTHVPDIGGKLLLIIVSASAFGAIALLIAFFLSSRISESVNEPLNFLIDRTNDIADKKAVLEPLEGLSGDWLELGEIIDTAVSTMRSTTQNLKIKLNSQKEELVESKRIAEESSAKLSGLNQQIVNQTKQISEVSKQINQANRQAIVVQHKLDAVLQSSTEGFLLLDQYGNVLASNPVFLNWSGFTEGEIAGRQCFDLVRKPGEPRSNITGQAFAKHGGDPNAVLNKFHPECIIYHSKEDKHVDTIAHLQPILGEDNSIQGYVMVLRDKSLRSENAKLREEIISMLQDSIRVPIVEAESRWSSILSAAKKSVHPQILDNLSELHDLNRKLLAVVDSYLMMYGGFIPEPVIPKEPIVIPRLIAECLDTIDQFARQQQVHIERKTVMGLPTIYGNLESTKSILIEVLTKAISVTAAGGRVRVESTIKDQMLKITVSSSGPSLPQDEITDMFAGYIEGKHTQDTYAQRLSLYLARNNVERLGGQIWPNPNPDAELLYFSPCPQGQVDTTPGFQRKTNLD